jgi:hypothetical protein
MSRRMSDGNIINRWFDELLIIRLPTAELRIIVVVLL